MDVISQHNLDDAELLVKYLKIPENEDEYNVMVKSMNNVLDITGGDETHELSAILSMIAHLIEPFERRHFNMF